MGGPRMSWQCLEVYSGYPYVFVLYLTLVDCRFPGCQGSQATERGRLSGGKGANRAFAALLHNLQTHGTFFVQQRDVSSVLICGVLFRSYARIGFSYTSYMLRPALFFLSAARNYR